MNYDFKSIMSKKTDDELITILSARSDEYTEVALEAANEEFKKRNIAIDKIERVKAKQVAIKQIEVAKANEPLEKDIKILATFLPLIARISYAEKFRKEGYDKKLEEMSNAYFVGRLLFVGLIILMVVVSKLF